VSSFPEREGLQPERTALAWQRTVMTALFAQAPMVLVALRTDRPVLAALGAVAMTAGVALVVSVRRRLSQLDEESAVPPGAVMVQVAAATLLASMGGAALGLVTWLG
jgi:uncharacterized membrane protein YidH (DUF202 family)